MAEKLDCVFEHHEKICDVKQAHFCDHELDCDISKYKINQEGFVEVIAYTNQILHNYTSKNFLKQDVFVNTEKSYTSKRGPPSFV